MAPKEVFIEHNVVLVALKQQKGLIHYAQHMLLHNNTILNERANDREVMTFDGSGDILIEMMILLHTPSSSNDAILGRPR